MDLLESHSSAVGKGASSRHPWELARLDVVMDLIGRKVALSPGDLVLDIGCGDIYVASSLARLYPSVKFFAVDTAFTDDLMRRFRSEYQGDNLFLFRNIKDIPEHSAPAALVLLMDVIEHIEDDIKFMSELKRDPKIGEKTVFLITVPAFNSLFCSHDKFLGHYRRYTNGSLKQHMKDAGFNTFYSGYFFTSLLMPRLLQVVKERIATPKEATTGLVRWNGSPVMSSIIKQVLLADAAVGRFLQLVGLRLPGLSNYALCRRSA